MIDDVFETIDIIPFVFIVSRIRLDFPILWVQMHLSKYLLVKTLAFDT